MRLSFGLVPLAAFLTLACGDRGGARSDGRRSDAGEPDAAAEGEGGSTVSGPMDGGRDAAARGDAGGTLSIDGGGAPPPSTIGMACTTSVECDDGLYCNGEEACDADECVAGAAPMLADELVCTVDTCEEDLDRVLHGPDHASCNDDDPCTEDVCTSVGCTHGHDFDACPCEPAGECDPFDAQPCAGGAACRLSSAGTECLAIVGTPELGAGETCPSFADADRCEAGTMCLDFGEGLVCHRLCPAGSIGACGSASACLAGVVGDECIGVCRPLAELCDILVQDCADPDDTCAPASNPETGTGYTGCRPAGPRAVTQSCGGGNGSCNHGLVCLSGICRQVCDPEGGVPSCTIPGHVCTGLSSSYGFSYCE